LTTWAMIEAAMITSQNSPSSDARCTVFSFGWRRARP
jgi:hypothetical protein